MKEYQFYLYCWVMNKREFSHDVSEDHAQKVALAIYLKEFKPLTT